MRESSDMELVQEYARHDSETAFAELVQRHVSLVYSAALRHTGMAAQAEEITQAVFIILARKAASLRAGTVVEAWLYETARLTALSWLRAERRRQFREQEAYMQSTLQESATDSVWPQIVPLLDEAMMRLGSQEREAIVLRFFKDQSLREAAAGLNISEAAAQKRVHRALERLRKFFSKRGVSSTTAMIAEAIATNSVKAAPAALAKSVTAVALAKGAAASGSTLTLIKGALKLMAWTKMKTAVVAGLILAAAATTGVTGYERSQAHKTKTALVAIEFDLQADGMALARSTFETINNSKATWGTNDAGPLYSGINIERFTDEKGQAIKYTQQPGDNGNPFKYTFTLNRPVPPGGSCILKMQGSVDGPAIGLIKPTGEPGAFEYHLTQTVGSRTAIHDMKVFRLPLAAVLLDKSPADLAATTNGARVELRFDKILPPPGKSDIRFSYRVATAAK